MPFKDERSDIAPMVRSVISAWIVFLTMFLGSVLYSIINATPSDPAGPPVARIQVVPVGDLRAERADAPGELAQKSPAVPGATE